MTKNEGSFSTLLFLHIPRTGGTTVSKRIGAAILNSRQIGDTYDVNCAKVVASCEGKFRVIASHFPFGVHELLKGAYEYATILRDPVARAGSVFRWNLRRSPNRRYHVAIAERGVSGMLESSLEHNSAVKILSGVGLGFSGSVDQSVYDLAVGNLGKVRFVGFTEHLDSWLSKLSDLMGTGPEVGGRSHRTGGGGMEFSPSELAEIETANYWDSKLYDHAMAEHPPGSWPVAT